MPFWDKFRTPPAPTLPEPVETPAPVPPPLAPVIATGFEALDAATGGGIPRGSFSEITGPPGCGKTTLALKVAAAAQREGSAVFFADAECALDPAQARRAGVDLDQLLYSRPESGGQFWEMAARLADSRCVGLVIVDSLPALEPPTLIVEQPDEEPFRYGRFVTAMLSDLDWRLRRSRTAMILVNHRNERVPTQDDVPASTGGVSAVRLRSALRLELTPMGGQVRVRVAANPLGRPGRTVEVRLFSQLAEAH